MDSDDKSFDICLKKNSQIIFIEFFAFSNFLNSYTSLIPNNHMRQPVLHHANKIKKSVEFSSPF